MHFITIPRLGWSMEEGIFGKWLKESGQYVRPGDLLFEIEGEKAASEVEALDSGILSIPADGPRPGEKVLVGQTIAFLIAEGETAPSSLRTFSTGSEPPPIATESLLNSLQNSLPCISPSHQTVALQVAGRQQTNQNPIAMTSHTPIMGPAARRLARQLGISTERVSSFDPTGRVRSSDLIGAVQSKQQRIVATPRARKLAQQIGMDLHAIIGSGRTGRIRERDVAAALKDIPLPAPVEYKPQARGKHRSATKARLALAQRVSAAAQAAPVTLTTRVDATKLINLREQWKSLENLQLVPTIGEILIKLVAQSLWEDTTLNACWYESGVWQYDEINIAIATDTPTGLLAPVIPQTDRLSLLQIAQASRLLTQQARTGSISSSKLTGGTFSISNLGTLGIDEFAPLLNLPQAAILGVGRIVQVPMVRQGVVEVGSQITLSLTFDHRVTDGAPAARWLQRLSAGIEAAQLDPT